MIAILNEGNVYTAQSFQVNIEYYTSFYSWFITDSIKTIFTCGVV